MFKSTRRDLMKNAAVLGLGTVAADTVFLSARKDPAVVQRAQGTVDFFPGFKKQKTTTSGAVINFKIGENGPGLLLLHGYPQTHIMWRKVAPRLSERFTVMIPDLRAQASLRISQTLLKLAGCLVAGWRAFARIPPIDCFRRLALV